MQIVLIIALFIILIIALYYQQKNYKLQDELNSICKQIKQEKIKGRTQILMITDIVEEYRKDIMHANACTCMRKISDILYKKETNSGK